MNSGVLDMVATMSKFLVMGMSLEEVVRASTVNPAAEIGWILAMGSGRTNL